MLFKRILLCLLAAAFLSGCGHIPAQTAPVSTASPTPTATQTPAPTPTPVPPPTPTPEPEPFSILWITDTQNMTRDNYAPVMAMADWAVQNRWKENLRFVLHTGDIVGNGLKDSYWEGVAPSMKKLSAFLPLLTAAGNHDVGKSRKYGPYLEWRFDTQTDPAYLFDGGRGSYALLDTDQGGFLLAAMGITISEEGFQWLNDVFSRYPDRIGILAVHDYINYQGKFSSEGSRIYNQVVLTNPNVRFVICGHRRGVGRLDSEIDDNGDGKIDRTVYQMMFNFQNDAVQTGYFRLLTFHPDRSLEVTTYSPWLDDYDYYEDRPGIETFTIENAF